MIIVKTQEVTCQTVEVDATQRNAFLALLASSLCSLGFVTVEYTDPVTDSEESSYNYSFFLGSKIVENSIMLLKS